jgi:hypothetical protein
MARKTLTRVGLPFFVAITVGGMLYLLSFALEVAPLYSDLASSVASDMTNVGYPP